MENTLNRFIEELEEKGMSKQSIRKIEDIKNNYLYNKLKDEILHRLQAVTDAVEDDNFKILNVLIFESPAGDGYGSENKTLANVEGNIGDYTDLFYDIEHLEELHNKITGKVVEDEQKVSSKNTPGRVRLK